MVAKDLREGPRSEELGRGGRGVGVISSANQEKLTRK